MSSIFSFPSHLLSPKLPQNLARTPFLLPSSKPLSSSSSSSFLSTRIPVSFDRLSASKPSSSSSPLRPIKSQHQQQQSPPPPVDLEVLPQNLREIVSLFQSVSDPRAKYHQLLHYGGRLPPLDPLYKTNEHRVRGCVSRVWVRALPDPAGAVRFEADSDSALTKGLAALLVFGLSGATAPAIARVPPEFVHLLGLRQSLTPSRNNGFLNMLLLMQRKALQLYAQEGGGDSAVEDGVPEGEDSIFDGRRGGDGFDGGSVASVVSGLKDSKLGVNGERVGGSPLINGVPEAAVVEDDSVGSDDTPASSGGGGGSGGRAERIRERLERELCPVELEVEDVSHLHAGHAGVRGSGDGETHFNVMVVSKEFEGKSMVKRHRLVYNLLQEELQTGLHALSIVAKTPSEVDAK